ncbi:MAG: 16S rRNA (cytidine(1402)-2'-O)-methyltransferase [Rhodobacteraceae bacterium]|jgi:16S rRNA (cytidine1402-2'-O)-methyltransferase|uniref:16S rRNA (cytidine(1402)-2'-O)-methyltransferase n=1 Tax=Albidovulum sp. TaxID=1872424 RepID=UPI001D1E09F7|nr:16S rRNA (cytidine(1402)-2'-O)-methyltransferase [uncultured Defluviimonas sp.]MCB2127452.1 16S rRNA (cytidine(1402)-2'-O)-methyltransferase [Paracoccaceae bacterium]MCC0069674.1 16S rRNA (cytidine(1402)-2'-O)-methyltransferase [Paracoccaceae bacterium]
MDALAPGLYFVATPIGAARDITLRALDILATAEVLAAEDTRTLRHLMDIHGVQPGDRPIVAYHDHNGEKMRPRLLAALAAGKSVAYASEAGTPLVADPGYQLARAAIAAGHPVISAPGPSAVLAALTVSGLPSDRFLFAGFPPSAASARRRWLEELAGIPATLILYESPKRVQGLLTELRDSLGNDRQAAVCRELTKRFEEVSRGTLEELARDFAERSVKGEIVIVIDRAGAAAPDPAEVEARLREALKCHSIRDAAAEVSAALGLPRRQVYQTALRLANGG